MSDELRTEEVHALIRHAALEGVNCFDFSGGEPLLRADLLELLSMALSKDFAEVSIATNATLFTKDLVANMAAAQQHSGKRVVWRVSLDGATSKTHDWLRGPGSFRRALEGLDTLVRFGMFPQEINSVIHRGNVHELRELVVLAKQLGAVSMAWFPILPLGRGARIQYKQLTYKDWIEQIHLLRTRFEAEYNIHIWVHGPVGNASAHAHINAQRFKPCKIKRPIVGINARGDVYVGGCLKALAAGDPTANIRQDSLAEIWMRLTAETSALERRCEACNFIAYCRGLCRFCEYMSLHAECPNFDCWRNWITERREGRNLSVVE
jgi:radical SAM protein with 4Fe4S-binding SPASM domain